MKKRIIHIGEIVPKIKIGKFEKLVYEVYLDYDELEAMAIRAMRNAKQRSKDGPIEVLVKAVLKDGTEAGTTTGTSDKLAGTRAPSAGR